MKCFPTYVSDQMDPMAGIRIQAESINDIFVTKNFKDSDFPSQINVTEMGSYPLLMQSISHA